MAAKGLTDNNWWNPTITSGGEQLVERTPYDLGNVTGATTLDVGANESLSATLTGNAQFALSSGHYVGQDLYLFLTQDGTGGRTATWPANAVLASGNTLSLSPAAGAVDSLTLRWTGSVWREIARSQANVPTVVAADTPYNSFKTQENDFLGATGTIHAPWLALAVSSGHD